MAKVASGWKNGNTGNDSYTKLLLHCHGTNNGTSFIDSSASAHTMTANGSSHIDTSLSHFVSDGASCKLNGSPDYLSTPDSTDFQFGTGNFTIDCWINVDVANGGINIFPAASYDTVAGNGWTFGAGYLAGFTFQASSGGPFVANYNAAYQGFSGNAWVHVALVRSSGKFLFFLNGVTQTVYVITDLGSSAIPLSAHALDVGLPSTAAQKGWLQELRISKGIARWTSNFTPLPRPYA